MKKGSKTKKKIKIHAASDVPTHVGLLAARKALSKTRKNREEKRKRRQRKRNASILPSLQELCDSLPQANEKTEQRWDLTRSKVRKQIVALEAARLRSVNNDPRFLEDPIESVRNHLESTLPAPLAESRSQKGSKHSKKKNKRKIVSREERERVLLEHEASRMR